MSHNVNLQHIIFRTYRSQTTIPNEAKRAMFKYIWNLCQQNNWHLVEINACLNHIHMLVDIPANVGVSQVVSKIKSNSSRVFKRSALMPYFDGWAKRYGSFSVSFSDKMKIKNYIHNQEAHHMGESFEAEIRRIFTENGMHDVDEFLSDE